MSAQTLILGCSRRGAGTGGARSASGGLDALACAFLRSGMSPSESSVGGVGHDSNTGGCDDDEDDDDL